MGYKITDQNNVDKIIAVGGKAEKFAPNVNFSYRFGSGIEHRFLNVNYADMYIVDEEEYVVGEYVEITAANETVKVFVEGQVLKFDIVAAEKSPKNIWTFDLTHSSDVKFDYQDTLENDYKANNEGFNTLEEFLACATRRDAVVGSYAVYCGLHGETKGFVPRTGKLCHIYRPFVHDAVGNHTWGAYILTPLGVGRHRLEIEVDPNWLQNAVYPITIDPDFGDSSCGASNFGGNRARPYATADYGAGNFTKVGSCGKTTSSFDKNLSMSIHRDEGGGNDTKLETEVTRVFVGGSGEDDCSDGTGETQTYAHSGDPATGGTYWFVGVVSDANYMKWCYDSDTNSVKSKSDHTEEDISGLGDSSIKISIWGEYDAGAGGDPEALLIGGKLARGGLLQGRLVG